MKNWLIGCAGILSIWVLWMAMVCGMSVFVIQLVEWLAGVIR